jgi:hypothetical protein
MIRGRGRVVEDVDVDDAPDAVEVVGNGKRKRMSVDRYDAKPASCRRSRPAIGEPAQQPAQQRDQTDVGISPARSRSGGNSSVSPSGAAKSIGPSTDPLSVFGAFGFTVEGRKSDTAFGEILS